MIPHVNQSRHSLHPLVNMATKTKNLDFYSLPCQSSQRCGAFQLKCVEIRGIKIGLDYPMSINNPSRRVRFLTSGVQSRSKPRSARKKKRRRRLSRLRRWARRSLARRFCPASQQVDPQKVTACGLCVLRPVTGQAVRLETLKVVAPWRDPKVRKKFFKICHRLLRDLGLSLVGPIPVMILQKMWDHFGEEHFNTHGRGCWCRLCRSTGTAQLSFLSDVWDSVVTYLVKMPLYALKHTLVPAPLRAAHFVANKVWQWYKVLFRD